MIGKMTTLAVLATALLAGLGTTVWTLATTAPVEIPQQNPLAMSTHHLIKSPDRIDNWTRVAQAVLGLGEPAVQIPIWLDSIDPEWSQSHGAKAMIWYSVSHLLARETPPTPSDYGKAESVEARKHAVDYLIQFSQKHPESMRYWHWNTLAWAWVRSGQKRFARGALQRTEDIMTEQADSLTPDELVSAIVRLSSCWSNNGVGDQAEQQAVLKRFRDIITRHGENARSGLTFASLVRWQWQAQDAEGALETIDLAQAMQLQADPEADQRLAWRWIANAYVQIEQPERAVFALGKLGEELDKHGEAGPQITWNQIGWDYDFLGEDQLAHDSWQQWLDDQQALASSKPSANNLYNVACGLALVGDTTGALDVLDQAVEAGWNNPGQIRSDRDFTSLRGDPRFEKLFIELLGRLKSQAQ